MDKKSTPITKIIVFSVLFVAALILSLIFISSRKADNRFVFLFESFDDTAEHVEARYINTVPGEDDVKTFVKELLLGPSTNRYKTLFRRGTILNACFIRDGILYLDLSENALVKDGASSDTERACALLVKNIKTNFKQVTDIKVFISGIEAYAEGDAVLINVE